MPIKYRHRSRRIQRRAEAAELSVLLSTLPPIPPGSTIIVEMSEPSTLSLIAASFEDVFRNTKRYDWLELLLFTGIALVGAAVGYVIRLLIS